MDTIVRYLLINLRKKAENNESSTSFPKSFRQTFFIIITKTQTKIMLKKIYILVLAIVLNSSAFAQIDGDNIFANPQIITIELTFAQPGYWDSLTANYTTETYMKADLTLTDETGTYTFSDVGVRLKGNSTYNHPNDKKSFKIDFNEYVSGQKYDGLKKLNFNNAFKDPTLMREKVFFDVCRAADVPAPRANFANVYMNGTLKGFYTVVEQIDDQFLDWKILDDSGNLFKAGDNFTNQGSIGTPADLMYYGANQTSYADRYELKTNEDVNDWTDLIDFIDFINNSSSTTFESDLASKIELQEYLRSAALDNLFTNLDSYTGSARNYYLYHNMTTDKWQWIKWDANETFGSYNNGVQTITNLPLNYSNSNRPLLSNVFNSSVLYSQYLAEVCYLTENFFNSNYLDSLIESHRALIQAAVFADNNKQYTNANFTTNINSNLTSGGGPMGGTTYGLKSFVQAKSAFVSGAIDCAAIVNTHHLLATNVNIYPNPADDFTIISWDNENVEAIEIYNVVGVLVHRENTVGKSQSQINTATFQSGMYFISLKTPNGNVTTKLMVH